ncbi:MAG: iron-containing alcohol dehydrogenase family protein, partial [Cyanothece sp. SIO1E1]|nr:iron-containing alcohol dehydrogenase family protein [Cyanothece sp. SIO1E1]
MMSSSSRSSTSPIDLTLTPLTVAPTQVMRGAAVLAEAGEAIARLGQRPLVVGGDHTLAVIKPWLKPALRALSVAQAAYGADCSEAGLAALRQIVMDHQADVIIGVGGGKALDTAKLLAYQSHLPVVTVPTSAAT